AASCVKAFRSAFFLSTDRRSRGTLVLGEVRPAMSFARPILLLACLALACAGCRDARHDSGATTLDFWAMGREGELVKQLVPEFERAHPGVRVRVQQIPWSAAHEKLVTALVGGTMPDAF